MERPAGELDDGSLQVDGHLRNVGRGNNVPRVTPAGNAASPATPVFVFGLASVWLAAALIFYWPGSVSPVPLQQWYDARTSTITQAYAPFMSFVWRWLDMVVPGPGLMVTLQLAVYWAAVAVLLFNLRLVRWLVVLGMLALTINPFIIAHSGALLTDVLSGDLALLGFAILFGYPRWSSRVRVLLPAFAAFGLAGLVRYQTWSVAVAALVGIFLYEHWKGRRTLVSSMGSLAIALSTLLFTGPRDASGDRRNLPGQARLRRLQSAVFTALRYSCHRCSVARNAFAGFRRARSRYWLGAYPGQGGVYAVQWRSTRSRRIQG